MLKKGGAIIKSNSPDETRNAGEELARSLKPGDTVLLSGTLGSGKTTFTQGMAIGLGVDPAVPVRSPTFTIIHEYNGICPIRHVDLYRIDTRDDLETVGLYDSSYDGITIIEWADKFPDESDGIVVDIKEISATRREISIKI